MAEERDPDVPPRVSQRYRELGAEEPPQALDRAILDAARRATEKPHAPLVTPAGRHRWYFSLAAAAILVLAVAITWQVERVQPDVETVALRQEPAKPPAQDAEQAKTPAAPVASTGAREREFAHEPKSAEPKRQVQQAAPEAARDAVGAASAPAESRMRENAPGDLARAEALRAPPPAAAPAPSDRFQRRADDANEVGAIADQRARVLRGPPQAAPAAKPAPKDAKLMAYVDSPERFLERIAELRKEGKHSEADQALAEFRARYPDYVISQDMRAKVERKK